jgi:NitT/TauT family transport system substrate-binding protein
MGGFGRILFHAREYWPDYMSCVLAVRQDMIDSRPDALQVLVDDVARSGLWLEKEKNTATMQLILSVFRDLMIEMGVLDRKIGFEEYTHTRFADRASIQTAWRYEPGMSTAQ